MVEIERIKKFWDYFERKIIWAEAEIWYTGVVKFLSLGSQAIFLSVGTLNTSIE